MGLAIALAVAIAVGVAIVVFAPDKLSEETILPLLRLTYLAWLLLILFTSAVNFELGLPYSKVILPMLIVATVLCGMDYTNKRIVPRLW